jgi:hypothetical protein
LGGLAGTNIRLALVDLRALLSYLSHVTDFLRHLGKPNDQERFELNPKPIPHIRANGAGVTDSQLVACSDCMFTECAAALTA